MHLTQPRDVAWRPLCCASWWCLHVTTLGRLRHKHMSQLLLWSCELKHLHIAKSNKVKYLKNIGKKISHLWSYLLYTTIISDNLVWFLVCCLTFWLVKASTHFTMSSGLVFYTLSEGWTVKLHNRDCATKHIRLFVWFAHSSTCPQV